MNYIKPLSTITETVQFVLFGIDIINNDYKKSVASVFHNYQLQIVVYLIAQTGVRYLITNPNA